MKVRLTADVHERRSGVIDALVGLGANVTVRACPVGDYVVSDECIVERKFVIDLHLSVIQGRLWSQLLVLRRACSAPFLLVEGADLDNGPLTPAAVRGALLSVINARVSVIRATDARDSALWLYRLAARTERSRPNALRHDHRRKRRHAHAAAETALAAVPGLSFRTARTLLSRFETVAAVAVAPVDDLMAVPGIGPKRAAAIKQTLHAPRRCSS